jgi:uncharacterized protein involved in response to NO
MKPYSMLRQLNQKVSSRALFFSLAALCALVGPSIWVLSFTGVVELAVSPLVHGRSMLLGFTSALIAGYLLGLRPVMELAGLTLFWLAARITEFTLDNYSIPLFLQLLMGGYLAWRIAPKFLAASKWRNLLIAPLVAAIVAFPAALWVMPQFRFSSLNSYQLFAQLLTLLMFFMAGRMITPLMVKAASQKGHEQTQRVQPNIERAVFVITAGVLLILLTRNQIPDGLAHWILSGLQLSIALLILIRIFRWQPWRLSFADAPVLGLLTGYFWLATAQGVSAIEHGLQIDSLGSFHLLMLGGLGNLSCAIILLSCYKNQTLPGWVFYGLAVLLSVSAVGRYLTAWMPAETVALLWLSLIGWVMAYFMVLVLIIRSFFIRSVGVSSEPSSVRMGKRIL